MQDMYAFDFIIKKMRKFFSEEKGFVEVPSQSRLSILAACEDPKTISQFVFSGINYPLPQTGQMWLEVELLKNPKLKGVFCQTTSYRNEPFPIPGRHQKIFPMFEFESTGDINVMKRLEKELLLYLGFEAPISLSYNDACAKYGVRELEAKHEEKMCNEIGQVISLEGFPQHTSPFWNMKHDRDGIYSKIDVILYGQETIGSAERSTNVEEMRENFYTVTNGQYSKLLFNAFGEDRVKKELDDYLSLPMIPRFGAGMGVTRMANAMLKAGILDLEYSRASLNQSTTSVWV